MAMACWGMALTVLCTWRGLLLGITAFKTQLAAQGQKDALGWTLPFLLCGYPA